MKNKAWLTSIIAVGFTCMLAVSSYASDKMEHVMNEFEEFEVEDNISENDFVPEISFHRGEVISHIEAGIRDMGFGVARISGEVTCHHPVEAIHIRLMLQEWNEDYQQWDNINRQDFEWNSEDMLDGEELTHAYISYNIPGCETGKLYRCKGIFGAWDEEFDDAWLGYSEGMRF